VLWGNAGYKAFNYKRKIMNNFESLKIQKSFLNILESQNYNNPTPIQEEVIPPVLNGSDVLGIAKTGSGKTLSYVLPILMGLSDGIEKNSHDTERHGDLSVQNKRRAPFILILVPTRELAVQVNDVFNVFIAGVSQEIKSKAVFGGVSINVQMKSLMNVNILVATPGRLLKLVELNAVHLSEVKTLVLDEADKILNEGFADEINQILGMLPKKRQNLLFSATLNDNVENIKQIILNDPKIVNIKSKDEDIDFINQTVFFIDDSKKGPLLRYLIVSKNMKQVLVFTSSVAKADRVAEKLTKNGIEAKAIHKKKSQGARTDLLTKFKNGLIKVLVTTDLLAHGIDIELLPYVINYELPRSPKVFIHRIGRTGRAESLGEAISIVSPNEEHHFKVIEKKMKKYVTRIDISDLDLKGW
jgi:ATP-dependent RNA helicase RhlE